MNPQDDTGNVFLQGRPDDAAPPSAVDLKRAMRDGHRARRRHRTVLGSAATAGVCAVAAVLAMSIAGLPGGEAPEVVQEVPAGEGFDFDPAQAGYPGPAFGWDVRQPQLEEDAKEIFGELAVDAGFLDADALDYELPSEEEVADAMAEHDIAYYNALSDLGFNSLPLLFEPYTSPGNGGQVYLRSYLARDGDEEALRSSFEVEAIQPGGWTAEPGPTGPDTFPQHLIDDQASWTDEAPELATEELDDGRTLTIADHGCALEALVIYPNDSALRSTWDLDCEGQGREMAVDDLSAAMLAMPQIEYDTSELQPVGELVDVPPGWAYDEAWEAEAAGDVEDTFTAVTDTLDSAFPGVEYLSSSPSQGGTDSPSLQRMYAADYYMPFNDTAGNPVHVSVRYYLPGGWLPGLPPEGSADDLYLLDCVEDKDDACEETEVDGRTVATRTFGIGDRNSYWVVVFDPDGWAVAFDTSFDGAIDGYAFDDIVALAASLPEPVYDPEEYDRGQ